MNRCKYKTERKYRIAAVGRSDCQSERERTWNIARALRMLHRQSKGRPVGNRTGGVLVLRRSALEIEFEIDSDIFLQALN